MKFKLTNTDLNKHNSKLNDATNDWQINRIWLNFEDPDGNDVGLQAYPTYDHLQADQLRYTFRNNDSHGDAVGHNMAQLGEDDSTILSLFCKEQIDGRYKFWGMTITAWIGNKGVASNWHAYNISNFEAQHSLIPPKFN